MLNDGQSWKNESRRIEKNFWQFSDIYRFVIYFESHIFKRHDIQERILNLNSFAQI